MLRTNLLMLTATLCSYTACTSDAQEPGPSTTIQSAEELGTYLRTAHGSPLDRLGTDARQRFLDSLTFGEHELSGFQYADLQTLPPDDVYQILRLFGAERTAPMVLSKHANDNAEKLAPRARGPARDDHEGYSCYSPHNCMKNTGWICMAGC